MTADIYLATCKEKDKATDEHHEALDYTLPRGAAEAGLPANLSVELFPGVDPQPGNPLAAKNCRLVVRGLDPRKQPCRVEVLDDNRRVIAAREVRSSPAVTLPLNLFKVIPVSSLQLQLRPIIIPAPRAG